VATQRQRARQQRALVTAQDRLANWQNLRDGSASIPEGYDHDADPYAKIVKVEAEIANLNSKGVR
jgi:hypothetical protein